MKTVPLGLAGLTLSASHLIASASAVRRELVIARQFPSHTVRLLSCLTFLLCLAGTAFGWIDNGGNVPILIADDLIYGHPGTVSIVWSGTGGNGSVVQRNWDPGTHPAGTQVLAVDFAFVSCETVYACPPGGRLNLTGTVTGEAADGTWQVSGGFYAQGLFL